MQYATTLVAADALSPLLIANRRTCYPCLCLVLTDLSCMEGKNKALIGNFREGLSIFCVGLSSGSQCCEANEPTGLGKQQQ